MSDGKINGVAAQIWVPIILSLMVASSGIIYGVIQHASFRQFEAACIQVDENTRAIATQDKALGIIDVKLQTILEKQAESERRLSELVKGVNDLSKLVR